MTDDDKKSETTRRPPRPEDVDVGLNCEMLLWSLKLDPPQFYSCRYAYDPGGAIAWDRDGMIENCNECRKSWSKTHNGLDSKIIEASEAPEVQERDPAYIYGTYEHWVKERWIDLASIESALKLRPDEPELWEARGETLAILAFTKEDLPEWTFEKLKDAETCFQIAIKIRGCYTVWVHKKIYFIRRTAYEIGQFFGRMEGGTVRCQYPPWDRLTIIRSVYDLYVKNDHDDRFSFVEMPEEKKYKEFEDGFLDVLKI